MHKTLAGQGREVEVAPELRGIRVITGGPRADSTTSLRLLASAVGGHVDSSGTVTRFIRDAPDLAARRRHVADLHAAWIARAIDGARTYRRRVTSGSNVVDRLEEEFKAQAKRTKAVSRGEPDSPYFERPTVALPSGELLTTLVDAIGVRPFAEALPMQTVIYEDDPHGHARPLPPHAAAVRAYLTAVQRFRSRPLADDVANAAPASDYAELFTPSPEFVKLRLRFINYGTTGDFLLEGFDRRGEVVLRNRLVATATGGLSWPQVLARRSKENPQPRTLELSDEMRVAVTWPTHPNEPPPDWYLQPDRHEPLSECVASVVDALIASEPANKPVVFVVSDQLMQTIRSCVVGGRLNVDVFEATIKEWAPYERLETPDGIVWRPIDFEFTERTMADRGELARYAKATVKAGRIDFRTTCRLMARGAKSGDGLVGMWSMLAQMQTQRRRTDGMSMMFAALVGEIDDDHYARLLAGESFTAAALGVTDRLKDLLENDATLQVEADVPLPTLLRYSNESLKTVDYGALRIHGEIRQFWMGRGADPDQPEIPDAWISNEWNSRWGWLDMLAISVIPDSRLKPGSDDRFRAGFFREARKRRFRLAHVEAPSFVIELGNGVRVVGRAKVYPEFEAGTVGIDDASPEMQEAAFRNALARAKEQAKVASANGGGTPPNQVKP